MIFSSAQFVWAEDGTGFPNGSGAFPLSVDLESRQLKRQHQRFQAVATSFENWIMGHCSRCGGSRLVCSLKEIIREIVTCHICFDAADPQARYIPSQHNYFVITVFTCFLCMQIYMPQVSVRQTLQGSKLDVSTCLYTSLLHNPGSFPF